MTTKTMIRKEIPVPQRVLEDGAEILASAVPKVMEVLRDVGYFRRNAYILPKRTRRISKEDVLGDE